jgi:hypothetical protein
MLPAQFRAITRWLHRSRRFRQGPALIFMLTAVGSAEAPIRFLEKKPAVSQAQPTPPKQSADAGAAPTSVSLLGDGSTADAGSPSPWLAPQLAQNTLPDEVHSLFPLFPNPQPTPNNIISPFPSDPGPPPAVDPFPVESGSANPVGNGFFFDGGSGTASNPTPTVVPPSTGTPVPEPVQLCLIAFAIFALRRIR